MKRSIIYLILSMLLCAAALSPSAVFADEDSQEETIPSYEDLPFYIDGDVSGKDLATAYEQWNMIPQRLRDEIIGNGVEIILTDKEAEEYSPYCTKKIVAFYNPLKKIIVYESKNASLLSGVVHEVGHALDDAYGYPSSTKEWNEIFYTERFILPGVHSDLASEFFADVFKLSIKAKYNPLVQQELDQIPLAKEYVDRLFHLSEEYNGEPIVDGTVDESSYEVEEEEETYNYTEAESEMDNVINFISSFLKKFGL